MRTKFFFGICALSATLLYLGWVSNNYSILMSETIPPAWSRAVGSFSERSPGEGSSRLICEDDFGQSILDLSNQGLANISINLDHNLELMLTKLDLGQNLLSEIPSGIGHLTSLKVLNLAGNTLERLPDEICALKQLEILGIKSNRLTSLPECIGNLRELKALFITDNSITNLPKSIGDLRNLKKLQAASNALTHLPVEFTRLQQLELFRCPGNKLQSIPAELFEMPMLMWLSFSNNPYVERLNDDPPLGVRNTLPVLESNKIVFGKNLADPNYGGASSSGVLAANIIDGDIPVVVKIFRRDEGVSPDGRAEDETNALGRLSTSDSDESVSMIPKVFGLVEVDGRQGLIMRRVPNSLPLGMKPIDSIKMLRCRYNLKDFPWTLSFITQVAIDIATALKYCHSRFISHGDVYAHNILIDRAAGRAYLTDFGAAFMYSKNEAEAMGFERIEARAFGVLLEELIEQVYLYQQEINGNNINEEGLCHLKNISTDCQAHPPHKRPLFHDIIAMILRASY